MRGGRKGLSGLFLTRSLLSLEEEEEEEEEEEGEEKEASMGWTMGWCCWCLALTPHECMEREGGAKQCWEKLPRGRCQLALFVSVTENDFYKPTKSGQLPHPGCLGLALCRAPEDGQPVVAVVVAGPALALVDVHPAEVDVDAARAPGFVWKK